MRKSRETFRPPPRPTPIALSELTTHPQPTADPVVDPGAALFDRACAGDRAAFGEYVRLYQDRLYRSLFRLVTDPDDARELTQEAFAKALQHLDNFRGDAAGYTWLFRIAMNLAHSHLRSKKRRRAVSLDGPTNGSRDGSENGRPHADRLPDPRAADPSDGVAAAESREQLLGALGRIDESARAVLVMRDLEGFDYRQMADVLDVPINTLKSRLFRARLALRDELTKPKRRH